MFSYMHLILHFYVTTFPFVLAQENKDYKEFNDKDCREVYGYKALFGDAFFSDKYVVIPTKLYRTGFMMFEDIGYEDLCDKVPADVENSDSSDEPKK